MIELACRHARRFAFDPARTAVLAIDFQRDFLDPEGYAAHSGEDVAMLGDALANAATVLRAARGAGLSIIHTREGHRPDLSDLSDAKQQRSSAAGAPIGSPGPLGRLLIHGEPGHDFVDAARPASEETVIDKPGFGAFYQTELTAILTEHGIDSLLIMGVTTQCCVFSTLREAVDRGFYCATIEDACAAFERRWHDATFDMIASEAHLFGWITSTRDTVTELDASRVRGGSRL